MPLHKTASPRTFIASSPSHQHKGPCGPSKSEGRGYSCLPRRPLGSIFLSSYKSASARNVEPQSPVSITTDSALNLTASCEDDHGTSGYSVVHQSHFSHFHVYTANMSARATPQICNSASQPSKPDGDDPRCRKDLVIKQGMGRPNPRACIPCYKAHRCVSVTTGDEQLTDSGLV